MKETQAARKLRKHIEANSDILAPCYRLSFNRDRFATKLLAELAIADHPDHRIYIDETLLDFEA